MKRNLFNILITLIIGAVLFYMYLPPINLSSIAFWIFVIVLLVIYGVISTINNKISYKAINANGLNINIPRNAYYIVYSIAAIIIGIILIDLVCSPMFTAKSYSKRITIEESSDFLKDVSEVDFKSIPLLDRDSSEKLGDRVMGQMSEYVSQYYVSDQYTQIN